MPIKIGNNTIGKVYIGNKEVSDLYRGATIMFQNIKYAYFFGDFTAFENVQTCTETGFLTCDESTFDEVNSPVEIGCQCLFSAFTSYSSVSSATAISEACNTGAIIREVQTRTRTCTGETSGNTCVANSCCTGSPNACVSNSCCTGSPNVCVANSCCTGSPNACVSNSCCTGSTSQSQRRWRPWNWCNDGSGPDWTEWENIYTTCTQQGYYCGLYHECRTVNTCVSNSCCTTQNTCQSNSCCTTQNTCVANSCCTIQNTCQSNSCCTGSPSTNTCSCGGYGSWGNTSSCSNQSHQCGQTRECRQRTRTGQNQQRSRTCQRMVV